jgi:hypothetical protein
LLKKEFCTALKRVSHRDIVKKEEMPGRSRRPWQTVAEELSHETDPNRVSELVRELFEALESERTAENIEPKPTPNERVQ